MKGSNIIRGAQNRASGLTFEDIISGGCDYYRLKGLAAIEKTPEPMKPIKSLGGGKFVSIFTKRAQADYKGTLKGGRTIAYEAKFTSTGQLHQSVVTEEQTSFLDRHSEMGAACFVLVSFCFQRYFRIPWEVFREMKANFGRKYITPEDEKLAGYEIKRVNGTLLFLEGLNFSEFCLRERPP